LGCDENELSILFTGDDHIAELNRNHLGRKGPTNVLAFPMSDGSKVDIESVMLGDVVISVDTARRESEATGESLDRTVFRLLIHGVLHLLDYDHERSSEDEIIMQTEEKRLLDLIMEE
jgi:probable rRNA maturation factor